MIGIVHLDIEANTNLYGLLEHISPDCIAVEISNFSVNFRSRMCKSWKEKLEGIIERIGTRHRGHFRIELLKRQISMPYEWQAANRYAATFNIPVIPVDSGELSRAELPAWERELLSEDNMTLLISQEDQDIDKYFDRHYKKAISLLSRPDDMPFPFYQLVFEDSWCKRERILAHRVFELTERFDRLVYIGGWMHLLQTKHAVTLVGLLKHIGLLRLFVTRDKIVKL